MRPQLNPNLYRWGLSYLGELTPRLQAIGRGAISIAMLSICQYLSKLLLYFGAGEVINEKDSERYLKTNPYYQ